MEVIIVPVALLVIIAGIAIFLARSEKKHRHRNKHQVLAQLRQLGHERQLRFSSEAYLKTAAIGLDGVNRSLLYFEPASNGFPAKIIQVALDEVQHCSTKHVSRSVYTPGKNLQLAETFIESICLRFCFKNNKPAEEVVFFKSTRDSLYEMQELGKACFCWESSLNKLITAKTSYTIQLR